MCGDELICGAEYYDLGCFGHCDLATIAAIELEAGDYVLRFDYLGSIQYMNITVDEDGDVIIDASKLAINHEYLMTILDASGEIQTFEINENDYTIFKLKIFYKHEI